MAANGYEWQALRARRAAALYDGYRIDHVVGFYRTYAIPDGQARGDFNPARPADQLALGETLLRVFAAAGARVIAEDLGTVPDFVRESLTRLGVPGFRVLRWEREWRVEGRPFRDPGGYPAHSVATTGTHDTETLAVWWDALDRRERSAVLRVPTAARLVGPAPDLSQMPFAPAARDLLLELLFASGSDRLVLPIQDVFGWRNRINVPAVVSDDNWTWRLPWLSDLIGDQPEAAERAETLSDWTSRHGRRKMEQPLTNS
jgi:4-alpha-glucanotransferase